MERELSELIYLLESDEAFTGWVTTRRGSFQAGNGPLAAHPCDFVSAKGRLGAEPSLVWGEEGVHVSPSSYAQLLLVILYSIQVGLPSLSSNRCHKMKKITYKS